jgi:ferredoxin
MQDRRWGIFVERALCVSSGTCVGIAPDYFEIHEGRSRAREPEVAAADVIRVAVESCPAQAISAWTVDTGEPIAPLG